VTVSVFETTIRVLGGLISTFELTNDRAILEKAVELGSILLHVRVAIIDLDSWANGNETIAVVRWSVCLAV